MQNNGTLASILSILNSDIGGGIDKRSLSVFLKQLSVMLSAGINIHTALEVVAGHAERRSVTALIDRLLSTVTSGKAFSEALEMENFDSVQMLSSMVRAGEMSGRLGDVLGEMSEYYKKRFDSERRIKGALMYPVILLLVSLIVVGFVITSVIPTFIELFADSSQTLPLPTRILLTISGFVSNYGVYVLALVVVVVIFMTLSYMRSRDFRLRVDKLVVGIPLIRKYLIYTTVSKTAMILSILSSCGVPILDSMNIINTGNKNLYIHEIYNNMISMIETGGTINETFSEHSFFPKLFISMIKVGEESGDLASVMEKTSEYYDSEIEYSINKMIAILEPALIILMALIVGFIVLSIAIPMFDLINYTDF